MDLFANFVLDRSGSMYTIWDDALGAVNGYINDRRAEDGNTWLTFTTFDTEVEKPFVAWNVNDLPTITNKHAVPRGMTALLDAFGGAIKETETWLAENPWFNGKVAIAVMTDGMENSSREFNKASVKKLVEEKQAAGWSFSFLGANQDAFAEASLLGIDVHNVNNFVTTYVPDSKGVATASSGLTTGTRTYRQS